MKWKIVSNVVKIGKLSLKRTSKSHPDPADTVANTNMWQCHQQTKGRKALTSALKALAARFFVPISLLCLPRSQDAPLSRSSSTRSDQRTERAVGTRGAGGGGNGRGRWEVGPGHSESASHRFSASHDAF